MPGLSPGKNTMSVQSLKGGQTTPLHSQGADAGVPRCWSSGSGFHFIVLALILVVLLLFSLLFKHFQIFTS